jgi:prepilin-type N-terminal cleavage/methylation domain-containing protein
MFVFYKNRRSQAGFSLVELMVVVAIIAVLAAIAVPRFQMFQAKAKQAEAKQNLSFIYTLEQSYQADNDTYVDMEEVCLQEEGPVAVSRREAAMSAANELGFVLNCAEARYSYKVETNGPAAFVGTATSGAGANNKIVPGCETQDIWTVNEAKSIKPTMDAVKNCNE